MQGCTAGSLLVPYTPYLGSIYYWLNVGLLCCLSEIRRERENIFSKIVLIEPVTITTTKAVITVLKTALSSA